MFDMGLGAGALCESLVVVLMCDVLLEFEVNDSDIR